jgi:hypothetical protein
MRRLASINAVTGLTAGLVLFGLGAFYRAVAGASQPGSLAMAVGFSLVALTLIYVSGPQSPAGEGFTESARVAPGIRAYYPSHGSVSPVFFSSRRPCG